MQSPPRQKAVLAVEWSRTLASWTSKFVDQLRAVSCLTSTTVVRILNPEISTDLKVGIVGAMQSFYGKYN